MPGRDAYGEVTSASNCTDYQARRLGIRTRVPEQKGTQFVHTLNGTAVAISRALIAVLENNQQADGSIVIPEVLRKDYGLLKHLGFVAPAGPTRAEHVAVNARSNRVHSRHDGHAGGVTDRGGTVGIGEIDRAPGKPFKVGSLDSRVVVEWGDVVVQVVDRDEENVRFALNRQGAQGQDCDGRQEETHG